MPDPLAQWAALLLAFFTGLRGLQHTARSRCSHHRRDLMLSVLPSVKPCRNRTHSFGPSEGHLQR